MAGGLSEIMGGTGWSGSNFMSQVSTAGAFLLVFAVFAGVLIAFLMLTRYRNRVIIFQKRGGRVVDLRFDRVREEKKLGNISKIHFLKLKKSLPPPDDDGIILKDKKGRDIFLVERKASGDLQYMKYDNVEGTFMSIPMDLRIYDMHDDEEARKTFQQGGSFWERHGAQVMMFGMIGMVFVLAIVLLKEFDTVATALRAVANGLKDSATQIPLPTIE